MTLVAALALVGAVAVSAITLTRLPGLYSDEGFVGSLVWSATHGHAFRPTLAFGTGLYENAHDYWSPRVGTLPFVIGATFGPTTFAFYRAIALLVASIGLGVFTFGIARRRGWSLALIASAALAVSFGFLTASHYVRWDAVALALACLLVALVLRGPPTTRIACVLGLVVGFSPDVQLSVAAAAPGLLLLVAWERDGRWRRVALFCVAVAIGLAGYLAIHTLPSPSTAKRQYNVIYAPSYQLPIKKVVADHTLRPLGQEHDRWREMGRGSTAQLLSMWTLVGGAVMAVAALFLFARRRYPVAAAPGILLLSHLVFLAVIQANKSPTFAWYALPYAVATIAIALPEVRFTSRVPRAALAGALLGCLFVAGGATALREYSRARPPVALNHQLQHALAAVAPGRATVMGDWSYWWAFPNDRFRYNSAIWINEYAHGLSFEESFHRVCPTVVLWDPQWVSRYEGASVGFPQEQPRDPGEKLSMEAMLGAEYEGLRTIVVQGQELQIYRRKTGRCPGQLG